MEFSLTEYIQGSVTLKSIWPRLDHAEEEGLVDEIVAALVKVHRVDRKTLEEQVDVVGYLTAFVAKHQTRKFPGSSILTRCENGDVSVSFPARTAASAITFASEDIVVLSKTIVLCHNNLEPRNVLVRYESSTNKYSLAAILDWVFASITPFAFEDALRDTNLGSSDLHFDWYRLFRAKTRDFVLGGEAAMKLVYFVRLVVDSNHVNIHGTWALRRVGDGSSGRAWLSVERAESKVKKWDYSKDADAETVNGVLKDFGILN